MIQNPLQAASAPPNAKVVLSAATVDEQRARVARIKRAIRRKTSGAIQQLAVEMQGGSLLLRGRCTSFYCKQMAQHAAMKHLEGTPLINEIEVDGRPR